MARGNQQTSQVVDLEDELPVVTAAAEPVVAGEAVGVQLSGERAVITLHSGRTAQEQEAQYVGINGFGILIPRGMEVDIPLEYLKVLQNSVTDNWDSNIEKVSYSPRFPVTVHRTYKKAA